MTCRHEWHHLTSFDHLRIDADDPIRHTSIMIRACPLCRDAEAWPDYNAALVLPSVWEEMTRAFALARWTLKGRP